LSARGKYPILSGVSTEILCLTTGHGGTMTIKNRKATEAALEEIRDCRAASIGIRGFAECLEVGPKACRYALPFGYAFLCRHPRMSEIIEKTTKNGRKEVGAQ
jgi:hypothetical protein